MLRATIPTHGRCITRGSARSNIIDDRETRATPGEPPRRCDMRGAVITNADLFSTTFDQESMMHGAVFYGSNAQYDTAHTLTATRQFVLMIPLVVMHG